MDGVLLVIEKPTSGGHLRTSWQTARDEIARIAAESKHVELLAETVVLYRLQSGLSVLARLLSAAEQSQCPYRAMFLDHAPEWISSSDLMRD